MKLTESKSRRLFAAFVLIAVAGLIAFALLTRDDLDAIRHAAEQGDADAQFEVGESYTSGTKVPRDHTEAARWYRQAAEQGHADALFLLGEHYARGLGVLKDDKEAARSFRQAAEQGHDSAQLVLAGFFAEGRGVLKDDKEAARWYRQAAERGNAIAQMFLGLTYALGRGVPKNDVLAYMWLDVARANGFDSARKSRDDIGSDLAPDQIRRATELARACVTSDYQAANRQPDRRHFPA